MAVTSCCLHSTYQWSYGHFLVGCGFGSSDSLTSSCFLILFWLFISCQKHENNIIFQAYVQLCMIIKNMNPKLYHIYCHMHAFVLIPGKTLNPILQPWINAKQICEKNYFNFYFFVCGGEQFLLKNDQSFIIKKQKRNHSLPPNSAVSLSLPAVFKILERYSAALCAYYFQCLGIEPPRSICLSDWRKGTP